jgi:hypothetical protein
MKVRDMWDKIVKAGMPDKSNQEITANLARMAAGKFSLKENFQMALIGTNGHEMQQVAIGAQQIIANDFKGDPKQALAFFNEVQRTGIGHLDFQQLVAGGQADRLAKLRQTDPAGYQRVLAGNYPDPASLGKALGMKLADADAAPAPVQASRGPQLTPVRMG